MKILLADDEEELARALAAILKFEGYQVTIVNNGEYALEKMMAENYDIILLDVMMPKMNGIEVVKEMRKRHIDTPVIMLTAKSEVQDKIEGLDSGADDYLTKPFNKNELLARLRAVTRNSQNKCKKIVIGNVTLNKEESELYTQKASFHLNSKECQVMETLISNQDKSIGKEDLKNRIWGKEESIDIVPMYISYLQNKFKALGADIRINDNNGYSLEKLL